MKADQKINQEVTTSLKDMFEAYSKRDLEGYLAFWASDSDVFALGSGADERSFGVTQIAQSVKRDWTQAEKAQASLGEVAVSAAGNIAWFVTDVTIEGVIGGQKLCMDWRVTGVFEKREGKWLMMQMHLSRPESAQEQGQSWPTS